MLTPADLARIKPGALLANSSRVALIEPGAPRPALSAGRPGFAAVDVNEHEPVNDGDPPLLAMPNVVRTPHLAWAECETFELHFGAAFRNVADFSSGRVVNVVNQPVR